MAGREERTCKSIIFLGFFSKTLEIEKNINDELVEIGIIPVLKKGFCRKLKK